MQMQIGRHDDANAIALAEMMEMQRPAIDRHNAAESNSGQPGMMMQMQ